MRKPKVFTPNKFTFARLALAVGVFVPLAMYTPGPAGTRLLDLAAAMFLLATLTDLADGYIARRYQMHTSLGRLLDPFVDKVLICGTFVFLAGPNFSESGRSLTGLTGWMVVAILSRELLATSLRGFSESQGKAFAATVYGKIKMFLQSATAMTLMIGVAHFKDDSWAHYVRFAFIWPMIVFTVLSMLAYISRYAALARERVTGSVQSTDEANS